MNATDPPLSGRNTPRKRLCRSLVLFILSLCLCTFLAGLVARYGQDRERRVMARMLEEKSARITKVIGRLMHKTKALKALATRANGDVADFEAVTPIIVDDPSIRYLLVAPGGIVSHVYPLPGNEWLVGFNLFGNGGGRQQGSADGQTEPGVRRRRHLHPGEWRPGTSWAACRCSSAQRRKNPLLEVGVHNAQIS